VGVTEGSIHKAVVNMWTVISRSWK